MDNPNSNEEWIGLIPAAGRGLRLGLPYPKELYPVIRNSHYKPVSQFVVDNLVHSGVRHVVFVINETKHQLVAFFGDGHRFGCSFSYVVQEPPENQPESTSPGLAHALDSAYHLVKGKTVFFGMADTIFQPRDAFAQVYHRAQPDDDVLLCLFPIDHPEKGGMVRHDGEQVLEIIDKPAVSDLRETWGCIIWRPRFTEFLHDSILAGKADFAAIMNAARAAGLRFRAVALAGANYLDLGTYQEIEELDKKLRAEE